VVIERGSHPQQFTDAYIDGLRDTRALLASGPRAITKAILSPVRFIHTLKTRRIGPNEDSARWYAAEGLPGNALVLQALDWRNNGIVRVAMSRVYDPMQPYG
jgi:hypothetical protein